MEDRHENGRRIRKDALPEHLQYRDEGCELAPSCLACPRERCVHDERFRGRFLWLDGRAEEVRVRRGEGASIEELGAEFGMSRRTVFRMLARRRPTAGA